MDFESLITIEKRGLKGVIKNEKKHTSWGLASLIELELKRRGDLLQNIVRNFIYFSASIKRSKGSSCWSPLGYGLETSFSVVLGELWAPSGIKASRNVAVYCSKNLSPGANFVCMSGEDWSRCVLTTRRERILQFIKSGGPAARLHWSLNLHYTLEGIKRANIHSVFISLDLVISS